MIKKSQLKIVIILLLSVALHLSCQSQSQKYFIINGLLLSESNGTDKSSVQIINKSKKAVSAPIPENGRFRLELEYNTEYQLIFNKNGNQSKTVIVNTQIPEKPHSGASDIPHFLMAVKLVDDKQETGNINPENQVQQICYSARDNCFSRVPTVSDVRYVEKGNSTHNSTIQSQENEVRLQQ